jgi:hypothetical protein
LQSGFWPNIVRSHRIFSFSIFSLTRPGSSSRSAGSRFDSSGRAGFQNYKTNNWWGIFFFPLPFFKLNHHPTLFHNNKHYLITIATFLQPSSTIQFSHNTNSQFFNISRNHWIKWWMQENQVPFTLSFLLYNPPKP